MLQILELTFSSMQMLLVWNLTEIDVNEPDKVFHERCLWVYLTIALSIQFALPLNRNLQIACVWGGGGGGEGGHLTKSCLIKG